MSNIKKTEKELIREILKDDKQLIKDLKKAYRVALEDIKEIIQELQNKESTESKIYRLNFQKALEKQISGILETLSGNNEQAILKYLIKSYENGFIGTMYTLHESGIPIILPFNQKTMFMMINKKVEDMTFAKRANKNMNEFKKKIKAEISRGIANKGRYENIAKQIELRINEDFYRSYRIARTEMGRILSESQFDSMQQAQERGCEIVKQWCATLDKRTRPEHAMLDGQTRKIDEYFTIGGHKALHPHGFGVAKLDINCRCVLLEKPTWVLGESELNRLKERASYYKLDKSKDLNEFKKQYINATKEE